MPNKPFFRDPIPNLVYGLCIGVILLRLFLMDWGFFWDNVFLISQQADYFYSNGFSSLILPDSFDSGHPTLVPMYVAAWWLIFGKSLLVAHLSYIPILVVHFLALRLLLKTLANPTAIAVAGALLILDPVYLTMLLTMNTELFLITGFILALYGYVDKKNIPLLLGLVVMGFVSKRGDMSILPFAAVAVYDFLRGKNRLIIPVFFGGLIALLFHLYHYYEVGWMLTNPRGQWNSVNSMGTPKQWLQSTMALGVRLGEFGRFAPWLVFLYFIRKVDWQSSYNKNVLRIAGVWSIIFVLVLIPFNLGFGARYFLPLFICLYYFVGQVFASLSMRHRKVMLSLIVLLFLTGHVWKYPQNFAQPWASTLRHAPIHDLMRAFNEARLTAPWRDAVIGTGFPYIRPTTYSFIDDRYKNCKAFDLEKDDYVLYFTTSNDFDTDDLATLSTWNVVYQAEKNGIEVILYGRK